MSYKKRKTYFNPRDGSAFSLSKALRAYLLVVAVTAVSFLAPEGDGREPLGFFGNTVPLLTVVLRGRACTSGLAVRQAEEDFRTCPLSRSLFKTRREKSVSTNDGRMDEGVKTIQWRFLTRAAAH